jgi:hypothetical protein
MKLGIKPEIHECTIALCGFLEKEGLQEIIQALKGIAPASYKEDIGYLIMDCLFPEEKKISDELYQMKAHMKGIQEKGDALIGVYPLQLLLDLSQKRVQGAVFNEISIDKDTMTIKGEAALMDDVGKIKAKVSESMKDVSVADIKPSVAGKVMFTVIVKRQI